MISIAARKARLLGRVSALAAITLLLGGGNCSGTVGANYNPLEKIGFPTTNTLPVIDGNPGMAEWSKAFRFHLEDGASSAAAIMRGMQDAQNIYLYFEAEDPTGFDTYDSVVLAFNPTNQSNNYQRLIITPCKLLGGGICNAMSQPAGGFTPNVVSGGGSESGGVVTWANNPQSGAAPAGVTVRSRLAPNGQADTWGVEIKIAKANYPFLAENFFGMFADVIVTDDTSFEAVQYTWPAGGHIGDDIDKFTDLISAPLPLKRWGNVTTDMNLFPAGLQVTGFGNIGTDPTAISLTGNNEFWATVANSPAGTGAEPDSTNVIVTYKIANNGLAPQLAWANVPTAGNPTSPGETIRSREYSAFTSGPWQLKTTGTWPGTNPAQTERQFFTANPNQCIRVDVMAAGMGSPISRLHNMHFVQVNSPFDGNVDIATGAWARAFPGARSVTLNEHFLNAGSGFTWESRFGGADPAGPRRWTIGKLEKGSVALKTTVLPDASLKLPSQVFKLDPRALSAGKTLDIPVRGGTVMTFLADGSATIKGAPYGAWGMGPAEARRAEIDPEPFRDALRGNVPARAGALLGSFDDFKTVFQVGAASTLYVPVNAQRLRLRFAGRVPFDGGGFELNVFATDPNPVSLDGASAEEFAKAGGAVLLPLGSNLPMHVVRGVLNLGSGLRIDGKDFKSGVPMGSFGSTVRYVRGSSGGGGGNGPQIRPGVITATPVPVVTKQ